MNQVEINSVEKKNFLIQLVIKNIYDKIKMRKKKIKTLTEVINLITHIDILFKKINI